MGAEAKPERLKVSGRYGCDGMPAVRPPAMGAEAKPERLKVGL